MTFLIACLTTGKGTWNHVAQLMNSGSFEKTFLVTNAFGKEKFTSEKPHEFVLIKEDKALEEIIVDIVNQLHGKLSGWEVGVNLISGTGKEHMALISALMRLGVGFRLVVLGTEGVKEV